MFIRSWATWCNCKCGASEWLAIRTVLSLCSVFGRFVYLFSCWSAGFLREIAAAKGTPSERAKYLWEFTRCGFGRPANRRGYSPHAVFEIRCLLDCSGTDYKLPTPQCRRSGRRARRAGADQTSRTAGARAAVCTHVRTASRLWFCTGAPCGAVRGATAASMAGKSLKRMRRILSLEIKFHTKCTMERCRCGSSSRSRSSTETS